jgi:hypothetical protein
MNPKESARKQIDDLLSKVGWNLQNANMRAWLPSQPLFFNYVTTGVETMFPNNLTLFTQPIRFYLSPAGNADSVDRRVWERPLYLTPLLQAMPKGNKLP